MDPQQIQDLPAFRQLANERTRFGVGMSIGMSAAYFSYILTIAFWPRLLGLPLWNGTVITWGFLIGVGLIALGFVLTAVYVGGRTPASIISANVFWRKYNDLATDLRSTARNRIRPSF